jgi:hypothetical protein
MRAPMERFAARIVHIDMKTTILSSVMAIWVGISGAFASAPAHAARDSVYTNLEACQDVVEAMEEGSYVRLACPEFSGFILHLVDADARENLIVFTPDGKEHSLRLPSQMGGGFSTIRDTVEWRGPVANGVVNPDALIVRYEAYEDPSQPYTTTSYLLVISLKDTPCLAERIAPMAGQNERAREAADLPMTCMPE